MGSLIKPHFGPRASCLGSLRGTFCLQDPRGCPSCLCCLPLEVSCCFLTPPVLGDSSGSGDWSVLLQVRRDPSPARMEAGGQGWLGALGLLQVEGLWEPGGLEVGCLWPFFPTSLRHLRKDRIRVSGDIFLRENKEGSEGGNLGVTGVRGSNLTALHTPSWKVGGGPSQERIWGKPVDWRPGHSKLHSEWGCSCRPYWQGTDGD